MKEIVVISGKGGTGKTSIAASFAALAKNAVIADCDVDAANLHLLLSPRIKKTEDFSGGCTAKVIGEKCIGCGKCKDVCEFGVPLLNGPTNDIVEKTYTIDPIGCEGCAVCTYFCPNGAIKMSPSVNGKWFISGTRFGTMVHAKLGIAEENSGKLVSLIRKQAKAIAQKNDNDLIIIDGSPGIGCPVIASITAADLVIAVTEPSLSAKSDLKRVLELAKHFNIPAAVCINKYDINETITAEIEKLATDLKIPVIGKIPYRPEVTKAQIQQKTIIEYSAEPITEKIKTMWKKTSQLIFKEN